jgi:hypothetical protein
MREIVPETFVFFAVRKSDGTSARKKRKTKPEKNHAAQKPAMAPAKTEKRNRAAQARPGYVKYSPHT